MRLDTVRKRVKKISTIKKVIGSGHSRALFATGPYPAMAYGCEVTGVNNFEHKSMQTLALQSCSPSGRGRSRAMALLINDDPTWKAAISPVLQWIKTIWKVSTGACIGRGVHDLGLLCRAW
eukprot:730734-Alexandrium_andersonii.AAC.1